MNKENKKNMRKAFWIGVLVTAGSVALYKNSAVVRTAIGNIGQAGKNLVKRGGDWIVKVTTPKSVE